MRVYDVRSLGDALVYWTDCANASYSQAVMLKKSSRAECRRLRSIADGMRRHVEEFHDGTVQDLQRELQMLTERFDATDQDAIARFGGLP